MDYSYTQLLNKLYAVNLHSGVKMGLANILLLDKLFDHPSKKFKSIHIAGTNGKGSVATKMAAALEAEGLKVGLFTSPHISSFRERIRINQKLIDEEIVVDLLSKVFKEIEEKEIPATFFEIVTILSFLYFADSKIDYAVIETGLGGRLDATNILDPVFSIITSISLEHTEYLGETLEQITYEKAGIIKQNKPIFIGPCVPLNPVEKTAKELNAPLTQITGHFNLFNDENNKIAKTGLEFLKISAKSIEEGLKALPSCRIELIQQDPPVILDVAHNPDGLEHLLTFIKKNYPHKNLHIILGLSKTKDITACLNSLKPFVENFFLVEAPNGRSLEPHLLKQKMIDLYFDSEKIRVEKSITESVVKAVEVAKKEQAVVVICGTFFIMEEARRALGIIEPRDPFDTNEGSVHQNK
jgi:dihydrofolate synthase/folylpolyglutamate synthase